MTMKHIARSFSISLSIRHPNIDPAEISSAVHLTPKGATRAGAPRTTPKGNPLEGTYDFSHWTHDFDVGKASELGIVLEQLIARLQAHELFFHRIVEDGGAVELFCGVFADGNWDEVISFSLMSQLAALKIDLRLDVYPKAETKAESC
jgi:hypothetical protein